MRVVTQAVEQGSGELFIAEDLDPFAESEVRGKQGRTTLVAIAEHVKEEFAPCAVKGDKAEFVDDEQIGTVKALL